MAVQMDDEIELLSPSEDTVLEGFMEGTDASDSVHGNSNIPSIKLKKSNLKLRPNGFTAPELPDTKQYHLFVSYASEDRERVFRVVEELETRHAFICLFADRDFQPGKEIRESLVEGINSSVKTLMMFTPNSVSSHFCNLEYELAYFMSVESGTNCVIPVLLEDCDVPSTLKPRTYIDATLASMDVVKLAERISESFVKLGKSFNA